MMFKWLLSHIRKPEPVQPDILEQTADYWRRKRERHHEEYSQRAKKGWITRRAANDR